MYLNMVLYEMHLLDHVVAVIICVLAPVLAYSSRKIPTEEIQFEPDDKIRLYHSNALLLIVFALVVVTMWRYPGRPIEGLGFDWPQMNPWVILLLLAVFLFYALDIFLQYGLRRWRERTFHQRNKVLTFVPSDKNELVHFLFLALAAGLGEEIIFRGYLINYLLFWTGNTPSGILAACLFSSALFAFLHGYQGARSMLKIFFLALIFSAIFILSKSLLLVILIHTLIDMLSGWIGIYILRHMHEQNTPEKDV
jgi:uncharacterized protein